MTRQSIDLETMRSNCIQIHQEVYELLLVAKEVSASFDIKVTDADELKIHPDTKSWDGMGRYAKWLLGNDIWNIVPDTVIITLPHNGALKNWHKAEARRELLDCYNQLGGDNL